MTDGRKTPRVVIIGSGFAGLCLAILLKRAGMEGFTILEQAERLGGTWRENVYPGAACDVPSFLYCFSFERKTDWSRKWAPQGEILEYMERCAEKYGILPHVRFGTEVAGARFDEAAGLWRVRTAGGEEIVADVLVSGVGQLNRPYVPPIEGLESFGGRWYHSARWDRDDDPSGKDVAVVGNAASAVQLVPEIAGRARRLYVLQRSANWMLPKQDRAYAKWEQWLFRSVPPVALLYRWWIWLALEARFALFRENPFAVRYATRLCTRHLEEQVADPELRRVLTPDYPVGAKRILIADDYYPALQRENVRLVTDGIERVTEEGIRTRSGELLRVDRIVLATGFESTAFLAPMEIHGRGGRALSEAWREGAEAYLGMTVAGFPNLFLMYGPNTNLGHNSIIFMLECQARYIVAHLERMRREGLARVEVRPEVMAAFNERVQRELSETVWARIDRSWYKTASGRITNNWPHGTGRYWLATRQVDWKAFAVERRDSGPSLGANGAIGGGAMSSADERRRDRITGLLILSVSFLAALCISWWAQRASAPEVSEPPGPPTTDGVVGYPERVDPVASLDAARRATPRSRLRGIVATGVAADGTVDVTQPGGHLRYVFQSGPGEGPQPPRPRGTLPRREYCGKQSVRIDRAGLVAAPDLPLHPCPKSSGTPALPEPRCTPAAIWAQARKRGVPPERRARIEYYRARAGPAWRFEIIGTEHRFSLYGDCERELGGTEALGSVP